MRSDDKLGLAQGSVSSTIDKVAKDIAEGMVTASINMDGHLVFQQRPLTNISKRRRKPERN